MGAQDEARGHFSGVFRYLAVARLGAQGQALERQAPLAQLVNFLLDTNVVSEWTKPRPNGGVISWLEEAHEDRVFLSVATLAELRYGVERLAPGGAKKSWIPGCVR